MNYLFPFFDCKTYNNIISIFYDIIIPSTTVQSVMSHHTIRDRKTHVQTYTYCIKNKVGELRSIETQIKGNKLEGTKNY